MLTLTSHSPRVKAKETELSPANAAQLTRFHEGRFISESAATRGTH